MFTAEACRSFLVLLLSALALRGQQPSGTGGTSLTAVKRLCVDKFVGEKVDADQAREIAIASLFAAKRFTITEKCDRADAVLKGGVTERTVSRVRAEGEGADFGRAAGAASVSGRSGSAAVGAMVGGSSEGLYSAETRSQAVITLRIVDQDGDVIWAFAQDSPGGKVKAPITDAVDRGVKQLLREIERAQRKAEPSKP